MYALFQEFFERTRVQGNENHLFGGSHTTMGFGNTDNILPEASLAIHLDSSLPLTTRTELLLSFPASHQCQVRYY
jgi:hypothetical protein